MLTIQGCPKTTTNKIDIVILVLVVLSITATNVYWRYLLIVIPCTYMLTALGCRLYECIKEKAIYSLPMLYSAILMRQDFGSKVIKDIIIYSLHIYLFTLNGNIIYLISFGGCMIYDLFTYNLVLNPLMKKYISRRAGH